MTPRYTVQHRVGIGCDTWLVRGPGDFAARCDSEADARRVAAALEGEERSEELVAVLRRAARQLRERLIVASPWGADLVDAIEAALARHAAPGAEIPNGR